MARVAADVRQDVPERMNTLQTSNPPAAAPRGQVGAVVTVLIGLAAGIIAALGPAAPTGTPAVDFVLIAVGVMAVVVVGERAPWWLVVAAAAVATAIAIGPVLIVIGAVALAVALWAGNSRPVRPELAALSLAITSNVLCRAELGVRFGLSAAIALVTVAIVFFAGLWHFSKRTRRLTLAGIGVLVLAAGLSSAAFGYAALKSRHDLGAGQSTAELGVVALEQGNFDEAADWFNQSADILEQAHARMTKPWMIGAAAVPVVAQHRSAVVDMSGVGETGARVVAEALSEIDLDSLRAGNGRIDVEGLANLEAPLTRVQQALEQLQRTTDDSYSPWLVHRAEVQLDDFSESIEEHLPTLDQALEAIGLAPQMLGADGPRTYLVLFTTPSESRGLGGMPGTYVELHADDGVLTLGTAGRVADLDGAARAAEAVVHGNEAFLQQYSQFGYDVDGHVGSAAFRNLTMTPDFPTVGSVAADLYEQTTGHHVDGVISMDPFVLSELLKYTGPIQLTTLPETLTVDNATQFLLRDQYIAANDDTDLRVDSLAEVAAVTFQKLMSGSLPDPIKLARDMGPLVGDRHLMMWSADPDEQAMIEQVHLAGAMPTPDGADGWAVTLTNAGGNKIDSYLDRKAGYTATTDPATGTTSGTLRMELTNNAPAEGLPRYVIGNRRGLPSGTSRLYVSFYSPLAIDSLTIDGVPTGFAVGTENGWNVYSFYVDLAPGQTRSFEAQLSGKVAKPDKVVTWEQPLANPLQPL